MAPHHHHAIIILSPKFMLPKRRFWKDEQKMKCGFSMEFSTIRSPNRVLTPLKTPSNMVLLDRIALRQSSCHLQIAFAPAQA
jgi:hypothetical protein